MDAGLHRVAMSATEATRLNFRDLSVDRATTVLSAVVDIRWFSGAKIGFDRLDDFATVPTGDVDSFNCHDLGTAVIVAGNPAAVISAVVAAKPIG